MLIENVLVFCTKCSLHIYPENKIAERCVCTVDLGPDLTEMFTMWGTLSISFATIGITSMVRPLDWYLTN